MHRAPNQAVALERARWLTELADAIDQAQKLSWRLGVAEGDSEEARMLYARLEVVRAEVDSLRFGGWIEVRGQIDIALLEQLIGDSGALAPPPGDKDYNPSGRSPPPAKGSRNGSSGGGFQPDVATNARLRKTGVP